MSEIISFGITPLSFVAHFEGAFLVRLEISKGGSSFPPAKGRAASLFEELSRYLAGEAIVFRTPIAPTGTAFMKKVWDRLREIPYGRAITYGELARRLGCLRGARAVGLALARNPIPIIIPCHRVVGSRSLGGFSAGLEIKRFLLQLEGYLDR